MNALFIGPYRQTDGWGMASKDYIKAIATKIPNITARPIFFINNSSEPDQQIIQYENSIYSSYDIIFQKTLPHCIAPIKNGPKNVGLFVLETNNISKSICIHNLNNIDEICVPSKQEELCLKKSGVKTKIKVVSEPIDIDMYKNNANYKLSISGLPEKAFKFYCIGEYVERKNFADLIIAFHLAFKDTDNVVLVIKSSVPGASQSQSVSIIKDDIAEIKKKMNIKQYYKKEFIISDRLSDIDIIGLHNTCDCLVMPSYGEAFCRPAAEGLILGKTPIVTDHTGMADFIDNNNGFLINSHKQPVMLKQRTLSNDFDIYNAYEYWYKPNVYSLIENMQKIYTMYKNDRKAYEAKREIGISSINQFSYETIGKKICD
jgi:glycosyltransferase involved in cell wall biosynthesis